MLKIYNRKYKSLNEEWKFMHVLSMIGIEYLLKGGEIMLSLEDGTFAVKFARSVIKHYLKGENIIVKDYPDKFDENRGVFVSLHTYPGHDLRGCIGVPEPIMPLIEALKEAAISAAINDSRFPPVDIYELENIIIEISILTAPKLVQVSDPLEYLEKIEIGKDGLIIEFGSYRGLLLPQVPVKYGWDVPQYLSNLCMKAGISPTAWIEEDVKIYSFEAQIFEELEPNGHVVEKDIYTVANRG